MKKETPHRQTFRLRGRVSTGTSDVGVGGTARAGLGLCVHTSTPQWTRLLIPEGPYHCHSSSSLSTRSWGIWRIPRCTLGRSNSERHADYFYSFDLDVVSQLERDISKALADIREWKNSFIPVNRIPLDILSSIPTHLSYQKDRFQASFVCRHWRRAFLQRGVLWSHLFLKYGKNYVETLLERAQGSELCVVTSHDLPLGTITLLSPHTRKIKHLNFSFNYWTDILKFPQVVSGPLPLLRTLKIYIVGLHDTREQPNILTGPPSPLFSSAVNLEKLVLDLKEGGSLNHFVFPKLTTLKLSASTLSNLFDFLKASPTLQTVEVTIDGGTMEGRIPGGTALVLPNVKTFSLSIRDSPWVVYVPAAHISCPRAKYTSLKQGIRSRNMTPNSEIFPNPVPWVAIVRQYTTGPVEEVTLVIEDIRLMSLITYSLTFRSSDAAVITLGFDATETWVGGGQLELSRGEMHLEIFSQACRTIRGHPLLSHVKRLHLEDKTGILGADNVIPMAGVVRDLFRALGPLDELGVYGFDLQIFLAPFIDLPGFQHFQPIFPPVKELTISEWMPDEPRYTDAIVELAKSQHDLGKPFERVTFRANEIPMALVEGLKQWVNVVDCHELIGVLPEDE